MRILALDLGRKVGWCAVTHDGAGWSWGSQEFKQSHWESFGSVLVRFERWLGARMDDRGPGLLAYEQVAHQKGQGAYVIDSQRAVAMLLCEKVGVEYMPVNVSTLKAYALTPENRAALGVKGPAKKADMRKCLELEWGTRVGHTGGRFPKKAPNEDETDALWLAAYVRTQIPQRPEKEG